MIRIINCVFVPLFGTGDAVQGYTAIRFPEETRDEEELVDMTHLHISTRLGQRDDCLRHIRDDTELNIPFGKPIDVIYAKSLTSALARFNNMVK